MTLKIDANFEKKPNLLFHKWQDFGEFWPKHLKFSKYLLWLFPFVQSIKRLTWKSLEELVFLALKSDAKFEEKLTCGLENDMWNMENVDRRTWKISKLGLWLDTFIQSRIDLSFQNWHEKFDEFWLKHSIASKVCTLMSFFWTKHLICELKKVQRSYV